MRRENKREKAARLVALDYDTDVVIARKVGVTKTTLENWKRDPDFAALVRTHRKAQHDAAVALGVADKQHRIAVLDEMKRALLQVIAERAEDPSMAGIPGGTTGHVVRQAKLVKVYRSDAKDASEAEAEGETLTPTKQVEVVYEYQTDTGTAAELRALIKQLAQESGEWVEKKEHSGRLRVDSGPDLSHLPEEDLEELERILSNAGGGAGGEGAA